MTLKNERMKGREREKMDRQKQRQGDSKQQNENWPFLERGAWPQVSGALRPGSNNRHFPTGQHKDKGNFPNRTAPFLGGGGGKWGVFRPLFLILGGR